MSPRLSVVVLTLNEAGRIGRTLAALSDQQDKDFEVVVVDAASTDGTVDIVRRLQPVLPYPVHVEASDRLLPIGEARNLGVRLARADAVAFLSADAVPGPDWTRHALQALEDHDMVFGRQVHAPERWTMAAASRGMRYHFPEGPTDDPLPYASNVASAYRKEVLLRFPYEEHANAAEDTLLARRAASAGYKATYVPEMVVHHGDAATFKAEMRKHVREGRGNAVYRRELGWMRELVAWGMALTAASLVAPRRRWGLFLLAGILWAPSIRRAWRRRRHMPAAALAAGVAVSPLFDLAFLFQYMRAVAQGHGARPEDKNKELTQ